MLAPIPAETYPYLHRMASHAMQPATTPRPTSSSGSRSSSTGWSGSSTRRDRGSRVRAVRAQPSLPGSCALQQPPDPCENPHEERDEATTYADPLHYGNRRGKRSCDRGLVRVAEHDYRGQDVLRVVKQHGSNRDQVQKVGPALTAVRTSTDPTDRCDKEKTIGDRPGQVERPSHPHVRFPAICAIGFGPPVDIVSRVDKRHVRRAGTSELPTRHVCLCR